MVAVITVGSQAAGTAYHNDFALPGTDSQAAADLMTEHGSREAGATVQIVAENPRGLAGDRPDVDAMLAGVRGLPSVAAVGPLTISESGTIGYATVTLDGTAQDVPAARVTKIIDTAQAAAGDGLRIELGGDPVRGAEEGGGGGAEGAGMLAALVILVLLFGSLVAAALPLVTALFAVGARSG